MIKDKLFPKLSTINCQLSTKIYPGLFIAAGVICGGNSWILSAVVGALLIPFFPRKQVLTFAVAALLALTVGLISDYRPASSYLNQLGERDAAAEIRVRVTDTTYGGEKIPWLNPPVFFQARIVAMRLNGEKDFVPAGGKIMIRAEDAKPFFGDFLQLNGVFRHPRNESFYRRHIVKADSVEEREGVYGVIGFDYGTYLNNRGIERIFYASECQVAEGEPGIFQKGYRLILRGREAALAAVASHMRTDENKGMIAALLFGCPQGVSKEMRKSFIFSGTVHVFTVSGLHVGIVALLAGLILRTVPFRWRYLLIPVAVFVYVLATGMNAPSIRAFTMITVWCLCRAFLLKTPGLNLVLVAAALLLLFNPGYLFDMGFQYSFITVGFLILCTGIVTRINDAIFERQRWIPATHLGWRARLLRKWGGSFCGTLCGCITAWLAGSAIALTYQGIYVPFSVMANLLLVPLVWVLYPLALLAPLFEPVAWLMEWILGAMRTICDFFYYCFESTPCAKPPLWSIFVFFPALALMLAVKRKAVAFTAGAVVLATIGYWHCLALARPPSVMVMHGGGSNVPALVISAPGSDDAVMVNVPSYEAGSAAAYLLRSRGVRHIGKLLFIRGLKNHVAGAERLLDSIVVDEIVVPAHFSKREYLHRILAATTQKVRDSSTNPKLSTENQHSVIEYSYGSFIIKADVLQTDHGITRIVLTASGYEPVSLELTNSSILEIEEYEFR